MFLSGKAMRQVLQRNQGGPQPKEKTQWGWGNVLGPGTGLPCPATAPPPSPFSGQRVCVAGECEAHPGADTLGWCRSTVRD